ncbi:hypothetical protein ACFFX0_07330 [Citricoccus parietis]|uniref:Uncharacterized protein n=1 Tax=Citricoccus parietis TaxID=592307 RepID=A0ABV5FX54_9MICC
MQLCPGDGRQPDHVTGVARNLRGVQEDPEPRGAGGRAPRGLQMWVGRNGVGRRGPAGHGIGGVGRHPAHSSGAAYSTAQYIAPSSRARSRRSTVPDSGPVPRNIFTSRLNCSALAGGSVRNPASESSTERVRSSWMTGACGFSSGPRTRMNPPTLQSGKARWRATIAGARDGGERRRSPRHISAPSHR